MTRLPKSIGKQKRAQRYLFCLCLIMVGVLLPATTTTNHVYARRTTVSDFPVVSPNYIYNQLFTMVSRFQHREAGYGSRGHDEFATYWTREVLHDLQGFGTQARQDPFKVKGWSNRPAATAGLNVEVTVPGAVHPEQIVVIGCHYDGEAFSTQSANDDASGCALELGIAQALGTFWHSHHVYPARTLRFVIFDAEEQGLHGSFHYLNDSINGDTHNVVAMFNEEQNGIAYPLRYLGQVAQPLLPLYIETSPLQNTEFYPAQNKLSQAQRDKIKHFNTLLQQAVGAVFAEFQALGYQGLTYHDENNQEQAQPIFTQAQTNNVHIENDYLGSSDQVPFTLAGMPCATFVGNVTYYSDKPPAWSYPYDQPQDTIQLMNTFADGSSEKANALTLSLALPAMLTAWMLHQPDILGETKTVSHPVVAISDIGLVQVHSRLQVDASASFVPYPATAAPTYTWDFGDGSTASGIAVSHSYAAIDTYTLKLLVHSSSGTYVVSKIVNVVGKPVSYDNPYNNYQGSGTPRSNSQVKLPQPNDALTDEIVSLSSPTAPAVARPSQNTHTVLPQPFGLIGGLLLLLAAIIGLGSIALIVTSKRNLKATRKP